MVIATGLPFEVVAGFTETQFVAIQKAILRHWETTASVNGLRALSGGGKSKDSTAEIEKKVKRMKQATGKKTLDIWEVV